MIFNVTIHTLHTWGFLHQFASFPSLTRREIISLWYRITSRSILGCATVRIMCSKGTVSRTRGTKKEVENSHNFSRNCIQQQWLLILCLVIWYIMQRLHHLVCTYAWFVTQSPWNCSFFKLFSVIGWRICVYQVELNPKKKTVWKATVATSWPSLLSQKSFQLFCTTRISHVLSFVSEEL